MLARQSVTAFIALGSNLGDARAQVLAAIQAIGQLQETRLKASSRLYRTAPFQAQGPEFVNAVVKVDSGLNALALLQALQALENEAGRERPYPNAPRTLDLDLLMYGRAQMQSPLLTLPHPRMMQRAFVLYPLADVLPGFIQPHQWRAVQEQAIEVLESA